jgi:hypothetical protein
MFAAKDVIHQDQACAPVVFRQHLCALPDVMRRGSARYFAVSAIFMVVAVLRGGSPVYADKPGFAIVTIAVRAIIRDIPGSVIGLIDRRARGYTCDSIRRRSA